MKFRIFVIGFSALCILAGACATRDARIRKHEDVFESFNHDVQEKVRAGKIDIGFDKNMVFMALGGPDREYTRKTHDGVKQVWVYTDTSMRFGHYHSPGMLDRRYRYGRHYPHSDLFWMDVPVYNEFETLRVEFKDGVVSAINELER